MRRFLHLLLSAFFIFILNWNASASMPHTSLTDEIYPEITENYLFFANAAVSLSITSQLADTDGDGMISVDDIITYTFTIENTGEVDLNGITIINSPIPVSGGSIATLTPGQTDATTFSATYALTQSDIDAGSYFYSAEVSATDPDMSSVTIGGNDNLLIDRLPSISLSKSGTYVDIINFGSYSAGDRIDYTFSITNTGNVTLTNVTLSDLNATVTGDPIPSMAPGAINTETYTASYILTQADIDAGTYANAASVSGTPPAGSGANPTDEDSDTTPLLRNPSISLSKTGTYVDVINIGSYSAGDRIDYTFSITNTGNVTLTNVTLSDLNATVTGDPIPSMAPGAINTETYTASYILTQADIDAGTYANAASVSGTPPAGSGANPTDEDSDTTPLLRNPSISLSKTGTYVDVINIGSYSAGDRIDYTFSITNTGNVTLTNVTLSDLNATVTGDPIPSMAPGAINTETYTASYILTQADIDAGTYANAASVSGTPPAGSGANPTDEDSDTTPLLRNPSISLSKTGTYVDVINIGSYSAGDRIDYTFSITNTGNVTLTNVTITDPTATVTGTPITSLAPGAINTNAYTATYTLTQADIDAGTYFSTASVTGTSPSGSQLSNSDSDTQSIIRLPDLSISKTSVKTEYTTAGEVINYTVVVTNTGNVTLSNVAVNDPLTGLNTTVTTLIPNAEQIFNTAYTITQTDIENGSFTNTATASTSSISKTSSVTLPAVKTPEITITIDASPEIFSQAGEIIDYTLTITNTGNVILSNIEISDVLTNFTLTIGSLTPGTSQIYNTSYTIKPGDLINGFVTNTVTASTTYDSQAYIFSGGKSVYVNSADISISKNVNNNRPQVGSQVVFALTVTNHGPDNATLVTATDVLPNGYSYVSHSTLSGVYTPGDGKWTIGILLDEQVATLQITAQVNPPGEAIQYRNIATVNSAQYDPNTANNDAFVDVTPILTDLKASKSVTNLNPNVGDLAIFTIVITNDGPDDATGVVATDQLPNGYSYVSHTATSGSYNTSTGNWNIGALSNGASVTLTLRGNINAPVAGINFTNTVSVTGNEHDPNTANNSASAIVTPQQSDIRITKTVNNSTPFVGNQITFSILVTNNGPDFATNVNATDILPNGFNYISHSASVGVYSPSGGLWSIGTMPVGESELLTITATVKEPGAGVSFNNIVSINASQFDPITSNNQSEIEAIPRQSDVGISLSLDNETPFVDNQITFFLTVTNNGPHNATGVSVKNTIPTGLGSITSISSGGNLTGNEIVWQGISINNGTSVVLSFKATVLSPSGFPAEYKNDAAIITLNQHDANTNNNSTSITPNIQNTPPLANPDSFSTPEDTPISISAANGLLINDTDKDNDPLSVTRFTVNSTNYNAGTTASLSQGALTINSNGSFTFNPALNYYGTLPIITYTITDGELFASSTLTITVTPVNDPPVANDDYIYTAENTPSNINVLANDNDNADGSDGGLNPASLKITRQPANGTMVILPNFTINYTPFFGFFGQDDAEYEICDVGYPLPSECSRATIFINVTRRSPHAIDDVAETDEDTAVEINILANDIDTDIDPTTVVFVTNPTNGTIVYLGNGIVRYTPNLNYNGIDYFTYTVRDLTNLISNVARVDITIHPVPDPPVAINGFFSTKENLPVIIPIHELVSDPEDDIDFSTITIVENPVNGIISLGVADGELLYTPNAGYAGNDVFTFIIKDLTNLQSNTATVTIQISDQAPSANNDAVTINEDEPIVIHVLSNDTDPQDNIDPSTLTIVTPPGNGTALVNADGTVTYTPNQNYFGTDIFYYRICDETAYCDEARVTITILPVNDAPVAVDDEVSLPENTNLFIDVLANDYDVDNTKDELTITITTFPANGTARVVLSPSGIIYTPNANYFGSDEFVYRITDPDGLWDEATVRLTITLVNQPPVAVNDTFGPIAQDGKLLRVLDNDTDREDNIDPSSVTIVTPPEYGEVTVNSDGTIFYIPENEYFGNDQFIYSVCDTQGLCDQALVTLWVVAGNGPPVAYDDYFTLEEDTPVTFNPLLNDTDPNNNIDPSTLRIISGPTNGTIDFIGTDGTLIYTPNLDYFGTDILVYEICDGGSPVFCDQATVIFTITPVNDAPRPQPNYIDLFDFTSVTINVLSNDFEPEGEPMFAQLLSSSDEFDQLWNPYLYNWMVLSLSTPLLDHFIM
jgi:uncharacterized repeat protein (TIGR01451 family)